MAFTAIPNNRLSTVRRAFTNKVRIGKGSASNNSVSLLISSDVAAASGIAAYASIMLGAGDDAGRLLISPAASGFKVATGSKVKNASPRINLPKRLFREVPSVPMTVRHEVTPDGLVLHLGRLLIGSDQPAATNGIAATYEARAA